MYSQDGGSFAEGYAVGRDVNNGNSGWGNGFGGDWSWWIIILLIFGLGNNGFGGFGGFGNGGGANVLGYELGKVATTNDVASGFNNSAVLSSLNDLKLGQAGLQQTACQGFNGINTSILTSTNALQSQLASCCCDTRAGIADLGYKIADCCCKLERGIDGINYNMATNTCNIIRANQDNTQRIIDLMTNDKIESLRAENTVLTNQLSQNSQTNTIINTLRPVAQPAYLTCSPFASAYGYPFGNTNGCNGCGSF